jgi:AcrR family transcriptional regulator
MRLTEYERTLTFVVGMVTSLKSLKKKRSPNRRKSPTQERGQATVDAIVQAAARVLVKDGYDRASTNRIAEAAGVSIGSLYQYFSSKEALVAELIDRHMKRMLSVLQTTAVGLPLDVTVREAVEVVIRATFAAHRVNPRLHRVLIEQVPRMGELDRVDGFDLQALMVIEGFLQAHKRELRRHDVRMAGRVAMMAVRGVTLSTLIRGPSALEDEALVAETADLVCRYLVDD